MPTIGRKKTIPDGWRQVRLGDIADVVMGQSPSSDAYNELGNGLPLVQGNHDIKNRKTVTNIWTSEITKTAEMGDVILTVRAPVGCVGLASEKICLGRGVCAIKPHEDQITKAFLYKFLELNESKWKMLEQGSTFTAVNGSDIRKLTINLPPLPEQRRIVCILETWDKMIDELIKIIGLKRLEKDLLARKMLTGAARLQGFSNKWSVKRLGDLLDYEQPTKYLVKDAEYNDNHSVPVLTAGKTFVLGYTNENTGIFTDLPVIIFDDFTTANKYVTFPFKAKSSAMKMLKAKGDETDLKFVFEKMQLLNFQPGEHKRYWISEYQEQEIEVPELEEQRAIASVLTKADEIIYILKKKLANLQSQKTYLLNALMTGTIRAPETLTVITEK